MYKSRGYTVRFELSDIDLLALFAELYMTRDTQSAYARTHTRMHKHIYAIIYIS